MSSLAELYMCKTQSQKEIRGQRMSVDTKSFQRRETCRETSDGREIHNPGRLVPTTRRQQNLLRLSFICVKHKARRRLEASERGSTQKIPASRNLSRNQRRTRNPQPGLSCSNHTPTTKSSSAELYMCKTQSQKEIEASERGSTQKIPASRDQLQGVVKVARAQGQRGFAKGNE
ncbi:hypothetical protein MHU86_21619 [Fragilaria crotonensis]|nr:hypothetical protein MHU86_21619 [Fragilaria crotonensis]